MFICILITAALTFVVNASSYSQHNNTDILTVRTRTGTFIGDLNDTYADVRQFKWIPYAKVHVSIPPHNHITLVLTNTATCWQQTMDSTRDTRR